MIKGGYNSVVKSLREGITIHLNHIVTNVSYGIKEPRCNTIFLGLLRREEEIGMVVAKSDSNSEPCTSYNCYKVAALTETILETSQVFNLKDRYVLGEQLGWGQFGVIRPCSDKLTGEVLAYKSIAKDRLVTSDDLRSVKLEVKIMARLSGHPNVVDLKAVYEEEGFVHLVIERCVEGEFFHRLEKHEWFSESKAKVIFRHLMQVVLYCHENGVVYRDLKPENILVATRSSSPIKLADFGLATYIKEHGQWKIVEEDLPPPKPPDLN
ncbi:calcium-dependent protein kinase 10-like [Vigna umbellata]|uniref:calcium-dependent protein kinase 10-like n=1 Tax=Vigna umbellata TaxID=87088 RepID=UPI001F5F4D9A|nr:calcium-dependent protein kinase 10-like [Vigna umbellata]